MIREQIIFYGRVQGVGFRYKARYMADSLGLTGYVHNEYNGTVRMEVQGEEALIDRLLQSLHRDRYIDIRDMDIKKLTVDDEERSFRVR
ncbi:MAG: acylphosphatase [Lachnospiraceae bacterium]|nr:acylphosphatase [Lachnospiraceae bacterium]